MDTVTRTASGVGVASWARRIVAGMRKERRKGATIARANMGECTRRGKGGNVD
jgi:hypothetical protein